MASILFSSHEELWSACGKMGQEMKLVWSFSNVVLQKMKLGWLAGCFMITLTYFSMKKSFVIPLPTMNSRLWLNHIERNSTMIGKTMSSQQLGAHENVTQKIELRFNATDSNSDLCPKVDAIVMETNSNATNEAPITGGQGTKVDAIMMVVNSTTTKVDPICGEQKTKEPQKSENISNKTESSPIHDDPKPFQNVSPSSRGQNVMKTTQKIENDANMERSEKYVDDDVTGSEKVEASYSEQLAAEMKPLCDLSNRRADVCEMDGDIRIIGKQSTVLLATYQTNRADSWRVRPYARKTDEAAMSNVKVVTVSRPSSSDQPPLCAINHTVPAIVFSVAGYTGNYFHDFTDVIVPLFLTTRQFNGEVQFFVTNFMSWWVDKYFPILNQLSNYDVIDFDKEEKVHCFKHAIVGLKAHNDLTIDPSKSPNGYTMVDFTKFMRHTYSLKREHPIIRATGKNKPRLLIIARGRTRRFTNLEKIVRAAERAGFDVVVAENGGEAKIAEFARIVNNCDVMMGVHGAGLTNLVFLPTDAVLIQVVPWGQLDWIAETDFGGPARDMKLKYLQYNIRMNESTLIEQYARDDPVLADPGSIHKQGWGALSEVYLVKQNVKLDVRRFRRVLSKAMKLLRHR